MEKATKGGAPPETPRAPKPNIPVDHFDAASEKPEEPKGWLAGLGSVVQRAAAGIADLAYGPETSKGLSEPILGIRAGTLKKKIEDTKAQPSDILADIAEMQPKELLQVKAFGDVSLTQWAAERGHTDIIKELGSKALQGDSKELFAQFLQPDDYGNPPVNYAIQNGHIESALALMTIIDPAPAEEALRYAIQEKPEIASQLTRKTSHEIGGIALKAALEMRNTDIILQIIDKVTAEQLRADDSFGGRLFDLLTENTDAEIQAALQSKLNK